MVVGFTQAAHEQHERNSETREQQATRPQKEGASQAGDHRTDADQEQRHVRHAPNAGDAPQGGVCRVAESFAHDSQSVMHRD
ncbi:hypothetical protein D3C72_2055100 [compost metagenome]